jgi:hypothetical protein
MIMDSQLLFSEAQSIAGTSGTSTTSTNEVYIPKVKDHKGSDMSDRYNVSGRLFWNCVVEDEDLQAAGDSCALTIELYNHTATGAVASGSAIDSVVLSVANTSIDYPDGSLLFSRELPVTQLSPYFEVKYGRATQNLSKGKVTCWIGGPVHQG